MRVVAPSPNSRVRLLLLKTLNSGPTSLFVLLYMYAWFHSTLPLELPLLESGRGRLLINWSKQSCPKALGERAAQKSEGFERKTSYDKAARARKIPALVSLEGRGRERMTPPAGGSWWHPLLARKHLLSRFQTLYINQQFSEVTIQFVLTTITHDYSIKAPINQYFNIIGTQSSLHAFVGMEIFTSTLTMDWPQIYSFKN